MEERQRSEPDRVPPRTPGDRFRPLPWLANPHVQTLVAALVNVRRRPPASTRIISLADGDRLALEVSTPPSWRLDSATVVMVHGLCGCHDSAYLVRLARKVYERGARAVRLNLRGAGSGKRLARGLYHAGRSDDILEILEILRRESPASYVSLVGFSLGGNIALKLAGELGDDGPRYLQKVVAVCPPVDLAACSRRLSRRSNAVYESHFVRLLIRGIEERERVFPELEPHRLPPRPSLFELDDLYTAPRSGFSGAADYYERSSAARFLRRIRIPCRILVAEDDPFIDAAAFATAELPPNVHVLRTDRGGHLGFLGAPWRPGGYRWMDWRILGWLFAEER